MHCPDCDSTNETETTLVTFDVPETYRESIPGNTAIVGLCPHCLQLHPLSADEDSTESTHEAFDRMSDAFPTNPDAAIPMALLLGLLDSLALYRSEIADLLADVERAGTDPLLVLDRLATDSGVDSPVDLRGRRRQLEQLL